MIFLPLANIVPLGGANVAYLVMFKVVYLIILCHIIIFIIIESSTLLHTISTNEIYKDDNFYGLIAG